MKSMKVFSQNANNEWFCKICDYNTSDKSNFARHLQTLKHIRHSKNKNLYKCFIFKLFRMGKKYFFSTFFSM